MRWLRWFARASSPSPAKGGHESLLSDDSIGLAPYFELTVTVELARGGYEIGG